MELTNNWSLSSSKIAGMSISVLLCTLTLGCGEGSRGPTGPAGSDGVGQGIVATMNCQGKVSDLSGNARVLEGLYVTYDAVLTGAGDVYVTATVDDQVSQVSGTAFFAEGQNGSQSAPVSITADYAINPNFPNGQDDGYWRISMNRDTLVTTAIYTDSSLGNDSPVYMYFRGDSCSAQKW